MTNAQKIIKTKVGLLELAKQLGNVNTACKIMGYSRNSFYRFKELYDTGGAARQEGRTTKAEATKYASVGFGLIFSRGNA